VFLSPPCPLIFLIFPLISFVARGWGLLALVVVLVDVGFGVIFIFTTAAAPNRCSLGMTNGFSQTTFSIA